ncbi:MAG TPA: CoA transferase [Alphaproteobacteria bacterium]|nr:CoA transferase [Alphaproteobacteria bacterium]
MPGVLDDLKVLDLSWGISGPMTTMLLADHGAEVTKIEPPGGDPFRVQSGYRAWNRGKRSAILDLKDTADRDVMLKLARNADVLVESYAPGVTKRLGIDFDTLHALNPRLIYCSITAYGRDGKHANRPGYDALVAARIGLHWEQRGWPEGALLHMANREDPFAEVEILPEWVQGPPRPGPVFPASHWPSLGAFYAASAAISAALRAREITGRGQWVETSLLQGAMAAACGAWQRAENPDAQFFNSWVLCSRSPKGHFECADGRWIHNWVPNPRFIITASEGDEINSSPDLTVQNDPDRFGMGPEELVVMSHYQPILAERVKKFTAKEWMDAAAVADATVQAVRPPEEALNDPLMLKDGCVAEVIDSELGPIRHVGITYRMTKSPGAIRGGAPRAGEHTASVKAEAAAIVDGPAASSPTGKALRAPLEGVRVLDLGLAVAGPYGTQLLSDLGADVIKVNAPHDIYWHRNHIAYICNRGKRSIALNLKDPRAKKVLLDLVKTADVVQHNMRYDAAERLGIDYESLKKAKPDLIYCHTRGHETGPRQALPGNDQTGACLAGVQWEDGGMWRGGKPLWSLTSLGDTGNGFLSAIGIMQALYHRERTGEGQMVDTAIVNAQLLNCSYAIAYPDGRGVDRPKTDHTQTGFHALTRLYETADGWLCIVAATEEHWDKLCVAIGEAQLAADERFGTAEARKANDAALSRRLEAIFRKRGAAEWFSILDRGGVPCEICDSGFASRLHDDPEMIHRRLVASYPDHYVGKVDQIGLLFDFSETPATIQGPPLVVGQYTEAILRELGYGSAEIAALQKERAIMIWSPDAEAAMPIAPGFQKAAAGKAEAAE